MGGDSCLGACSGRSRCRVGLVASFLWRALAWSFLVFLDPQKPV